MPGSYYQKVRTVNAVFSLAKKSLMKERYLPIQPIVKWDLMLISKGEGEKRKPLQRSHRKETISSKLLKSNLIFSYFHFFLILILWEFKEFCLTYTRNKYNDNCFVNLYREDGQLDQYLDLGLGTDKKTVIIALKKTNFRE